MILYFSGTGNSRYVANRISERTNQALLCLNDRIKAEDFSNITTGENVVLVTPTYAWRIPTVVSDFLKKVKLVGAEKIWFVMTCGGEIGNSAKYNSALAGEKNLQYMGTAQIVMPENYIALFGVPEKDEARKIVANSENDIVKMLDCIADGKELATPRNNLYDKFMSSVVNPIFYPLCVKDKAFYVSDKCIGCGKCVSLCPLNNIKLENNKPVWNGNCTHCMACISYCPTEAIEYGKKSAKKQRYTFEGL